MLQLISHGLDWMLENKRNLIAPSETFCQAFNKTW
jgi:hypothetical protein